MKPLRKIWTLLLLLLMLFTSLEVVVPAASAESSTTTLELSLPSDLTDWLLDENAGYIYAISSTSNNLYFIRLSDFSIEKTLNVGSNPSYLTRDGQSLQIALSGATMIRTVNLSTKEISDTVTTNTIPYSVAASSNYLFYGTSEGKIYKYDKAARTSNLLLSDYMYSNVALAFDEPTNTLYAGNVSSYGGITAISAETGAKLSKDISDNVEIGGSSISLKHIFIDDQSVYFGGHQFNKKNLLETTGTYSRTNNDYTYLESVILGVTDSYVLTTQGVYDKYTYTPLVLFPSNKRFALLDSKGHAYLAGIENWYTDLNKITRVDLTMPQRTTSNLTTDSYSIGSDQAFTDWATTDNSPYIYSIVASTNELVIINKADMSVVKKMFIGSNPSEVKILNNKAYVIFKGENHIKVMDLSGGIPTETATAKITTKNYPLHVYPDNNNRILYNGGSFAGGISVTSAVYTSVTDAVYEISTGIYIPDSYTLDPNKRILYGGDSNYLYKYNSQNFNLLEKNQLANGSSYYNILLDENNLYYGNRRYDATVTSTIYGTYPESIIYARGSHVFSNGAVYDRDSFTKTFNLLMPIQHAYVGADNTIFVSTDNRIFKFNNFEEMQYPPYPPSLQVSNVSFSDNDSTTGEIGGTIYWNSTTGFSFISSYTIYFLDQNGNKIGNKIAEIPYTSNSSYYNYNISNTSIPAGAVSLGVYTKNANGESSTAATVALSDYSASSTSSGSGSSGVSGYFSYTFEDQDPVRGKIHPLVSWYTPYETSYSGYQLTFADASGTVLGSIYSVPKHASSGVNYHVDIAENIVPAGAVYLDLRPKDLAGNIGTELYRMQIFDNTTSSPVIAGINSAIPVPKLQVLQSFDNDNALGSFGGSISWYDLSSDGTATSYDLYFVDGNNVKLQSIAEVTRSNLIRTNQGLYYPTYEITLPKGTAIPPGAQRIGIFGKNNQGEGTGGYYFGLWDNIDFDPGSNYFEDRDTRAQNVNGVLHWIPVIDETSVKNYVVKFVDSRLVPIGSPFAQVSKGQQQYNVSIQNTQIPAGASALMLTAINSANDEAVLGIYHLADNIAGEPVSTLPTDNQSPIEYVNQRDYDGDAGEVGGNLYFYTNNSSSNAMRYDVYFVNDQLQRLKPIISLPINQVGFYQTSIPMNTQIPTGATKIAVYAVSSTGMSTPVTTDLVDRTYGTSLTPDQIQITNNKSGTSDTITVSSLNPGDIVRVYRDSTSANSFLLQVVGDNATSVNFTIPQLGTGAGSLYFSVQHSGGIPSLKITKAYNAEPADPIPPIKKISGGGGGGGGGGGVSFPVPDANGKMTYDLQPGHVDMLIDLANDAKKELTLDATANQHLDITTVSFGADIVQKAADRGKPIVIKSNDVQLTFPVNALTVANEDDTLKFKVTSEDAPKMSDFTSASPVLEFTLAENDTEITNFNTPLEATFHYDPSKVKEASNLGVYWLDETTNTWTYMGGTVNGDGTITATLPHFSKYAVLEKTATGVKTFEDIQGHWAQKDIEQLVSKQIIDGISDESFKPDNNMTRAQIVTILKKALNLPAQATTKSFEDVAADSWYRDAVYAAYAANIVGGTSDNTFAPEANVTREQLAVMMVNAYLNVTGKKLSDIIADQPINYVDSNNMSDWAKQYIAVATTLGLLNGVDDTHFAPAQNSTRAEVATVVVRMLKQISVTK